MSGIEERAASGVMSFLFTDIEGSTQLWEADPEAMAAELAAHDDVLREAIAGHWGQLFKHTGDGVCAVFSSPRAAVDAAVTAQRSLELPVRMGIATGEAELRDGDYFGAVLNRAARIMAAGHGGQILLDATTAGLLSKVDLMPLGPKRLRDLANLVELFQVRAAGLATDFPPLKTLDATPGNLRKMPTSFVGRGIELAEVTEAVVAHRLVTLTGVGGVGKTRLALEAAAALAEGLTDGVWLVEFAPLADPSAVPDALAATLGITQQPGKTLTQSIAEALEGRSRLLVLDNCEHVLDAAAELIEAIFARSRTVRILATSREGLRVADEHLWPVPPLDVRAGIDSSAAELFLQRAAAVAPDIQRTGADEQAAIAEICRRLDGIPLAIELAASRMLSMTAAEVRDRLDDRFQLLVGSRRGLERHQTLRHAVQWSYDLLAESEKTLLKRCSVFAGGFDVPGASAVAGLGGELTTLDVLDSLVRKSLVIADRSSGRTRYAMLETIRQFAEEQLAHSGSAKEIRTAHARYFAGREAEAMEKWDSPEQREVYDWFALELPNLRTAFRWTTRSGDLDAAISVAIYATFLGSMVEQLEPIAWAQELIEAAEVAQHRRLQQLYVTAAMCYAAGNLEDFHRYAESADALADSGFCDPIPERLESTIGAGYLASGEPERCIDVSRRLIERRPRGRLYAETDLVIGLTMTGATESAIAASEDFRANAEDEFRTRNPGLASFLLYAYGFARREVDPAAAYEALERGLDIAQRTNNGTLESGLLVSLSRITAAHGNPLAAFDFLKQAIRRYHDSGSFVLMMGPLAVLADLFSRLGHLQAAAVIAHFANTPFTRVGYPEITTTLDQLADALSHDAYQRFARKADAMTNAGIVAYAADQIGAARDALAR